MQISDNARGALYMNIAVATFTLNDTAMKALTQTVPLFQAITLRGLLAVVVLMAVGAMMRGLRLRVSRKDTAIIAIRSMAEVGGTVLFLTALMHMPLANLAAIMQVLPLAVTLAAAVIFRERIGWRRMTAILIGFCGVVIIIRPGTAGFDIWSVLGLGAVMCVVVRDLATRQLSQDIPSVTVAIWAGVAVTLMGLAGTIWQGWTALTLSEVLLTLAASSALILGYLLSVMVMRVGDIGFVAPFRYTALVWAIILGWLAFGAVPDAFTLIGGAIVVATGLFTFYRERRLNRVPQN